MMSPMAAPGVEAYHGPFSAFGRLLDACTTGVNEESEAQDDGVVRHLSREQGAAMTLADLADGPYYVIASQLGADSLMAVDSVCRLTRELNRAHGGPWHRLGKRTYYGLELDGEDLYEGPEPEAQVASDPRKLSICAPRFDWKVRYGRFRQEVRMFRSPFVGSEINEIEQADEIAYCRCKLRSDYLGVGDIGVYLEVDVHTNSDNVSLAVVDFEGGGCSSVTFSPDTGAVIRERKVREAPRKVEGAYIQPLTTITSGQGFVGSMGLYLCGGHLAFFRRHAVVNKDSDGKDPEVTPWESTGFVTDLSWAEGRQLTPCLAFRDVGTYHVQITYVGATPPVATERTTSAYDESSWRSLHWDAGEQDVQDALEV